MTLENDIDHEWTRQIICPHCGFEHDDSFEISGNMSGNGIMECWECSKQFKWNCHIDVMYDTEKVKGKVKK